MSVIIISSDSQEKGREVAEKIAKILGYNYVGREILLKVAAKYNVNEATLRNALDKASTFFGISPKDRNLHLAYIQEATLAELLKDNVVCEGLAAHLYVLGVSHVLKVRILSDTKAWVQRTASQENISIKKAGKLAKRQKLLRRRWSLDTFKKDETDPSHYDLVISLVQIDEGEAVKIITETVGYRRFKPMTYSIKCMQDHELAGRVRSALLKGFPDVKVQARGGTVLVKAMSLKREKRKMITAIKERVEKVPGVMSVEVRVINDIFRQAAESFR